MATIDLLLPNNYIVRNNDVSESITNGFLNQNNDLQMIWGYERIVPDGWTATKPLLAALVTSNKKHLIIADIDGISIWNIENGAISTAHDRLFFLSARLKSPDGSDKYGNGLKYRPNPAGVSIMQDANGIIYITDGSIGGIYLLTLVGEPNQFFSQLDYAQITLEPTPGYVPPYQGGELVEMINPVSLEFYNPHIIVIDNRYEDNGVIQNFNNIARGFMYVLVDITVGPDGRPLYHTKPEATIQHHARLSQQYSMMKPIIDAKLLNNILYVISYDRIEMYRLSDGILPIEKIQSNALEMGCYGRHLLATFNGKLIFIGQNDNKIPVLCVWIGGERDPMEFNKNNLSYIFTHDVKMENLTLSTFATSSQEFVIINRLPINLSVLVDITENSNNTQNSYFIKEEGGFNADYIFQIDEKYYYLAYDSPYLYQYSEQITTFDDKAFAVEAKTMQYTSDDSTKLSSLSNLRILLQSLPEDFLNLRPTKFVPYLGDENRYTYTVQYKSPRKGWNYLYDGKHMAINNITLGSNILHTIQTDKRTQLKFTFYPKLYKRGSLYYYSPIIIKEIKIDADSY